MDRVYSIALDLVRGLSAQLVLFGHSISLLGIVSILQPPRFPFLQNIGVVLFFFISGTVIAHAITKQRPTFGRFMIDRATRIYTALIPAMVVVLFIDLPFLHLPQYAYYADKHSLHAFIGNALMMAKYPTFSLAGLKIDPALLRVEPYGTMRPIWSVAWEFWLYVFFGFIALRATITDRRWLIASIVLFAISVPILVDAFTAKLGGGLAFVWLAGAAYYRFVIVDGVLRDRPWLCLAALIFVTLTLFMRRGIAVEGYDLRFSLLLCAAVALFIEICRHIRVPSAVATGLERVARFGASYSYSLYLLHLSVVFPIVMVYGEGASTATKVMLLFAALVAANVTAWIFWWLFERHYRLVRRFVLELTGQRASDPASLSVRSPLQQAPRLD